MSAKRLRTLMQIFTSRPYTQCFKCIYYIYTLVYTQHLYAKVICWCAHARISINSLSAHLGLQPVSLSSYTSYFLEICCEHPVPICSKEGTEMSTPSSDPFDLIFFYKKKLNFYDENPEKRHQQRAHQFSRFFRMHGVQWCMDWS